MNKLLLLVLLVSMSFTVSAQEVTKQKEVGLAFSGLENFGFTFKTGNSKAMWRFNTLFLHGMNRKEISDIHEDSFKGNGFGLAIGREFRSLIVENFELRYGVDISFNYQDSETKRVVENTQSGFNYNTLNSTATYTPGIDFVFGANYIINNKIVIGAELLPGISYFKGESKYVDFNDNNREVKSDISGFRYGLSNTSALINLAYRF